MHTMRHLVSGGYVLDPAEMRRGCAVWRQAGDNLLNLPSDKLYAGLMGMGELKFPTKPGTLFCLGYKLAR